MALSLPGVSLQRKVHNLCFCFLFCFAFLLLFSKCGMVMFGNYVLHTKSPHHTLLITRIHTVIWTLDAKRFKC